MRHQKVLVLAILAIQSSALCSPEPARASSGAENQAQQPLPDDRNAMGEAVHRNGSIDKLEITLRHFSDSFGRGDPRTLQTKVRLAQAHRNVHNFEQAEALLLSAIHGYNSNRARQKYFSIGTSSDLGEAWSDLGDIYGLRHWYPEATRAYLSSIHAFQTEMGTSFPRIFAIKAELQRIKTLEAGQPN